MVIGAGPGGPDVKDGQRYTMRGLTGRRLQKQLSYAKVFLSDCWVDDVVACKVPKKRRPTKTAIRCCRPLLEDTLERCKPHTIVTLGADALEAFYPGAKITAYHGARIRGEGYTLVPMYQPNAFDDNPGILRTIYEDYRGLFDRPMLEPLDGDYRTGAYGPRVNRRFAIDTETTGLDLRSKLLGVSICEECGEAVYIQGKDMPRGLAFDGKATMHNAKYDLGILESNEVALVGGWEDVDDTMLLAYCMNRRPLGLKALGIQELHLEQSMYAEVADSNGSLVGVDLEEVAKYGCGDSDLTLRLWDHLWQRATPREKRLYEEIEKPLPPILAKMQLRGVLVDVPHFERMSEDLTKVLRNKLRRIRTLEGCGTLEQDTLTSPTRLARWLSALLKARVKTTDKYALERLQGKHPAIKSILEWRSTYKLKTAFVDSILRLQRAGLIFPEFNQTATTTGRMNGRHPNLQQLPKRTDTTIRDGFIAPEGHLVAVLDNSQIDLRSLAYLSQDREMLRVFAEDLDMHDETALDLTGSLDETHRRLAKTANFLVVFGGGASALAQKTGVPEEMAYNFMDRYWERHDGVRSWVERTHRFLLDNGYVETAYGRRRHIPKVYTPERGAAYREGQNMPVQGTSADVLKLQTKAAEDAGVDALMFGQVHDELDFYVPEDDWEERVRVLKAAMEGVDCPFRLKVEATVGKTLGTVEKARL